MDGETRTLSPTEAAEFEEYKRQKRETEVVLTLKRLILDGSRRETDKESLRKIFQTAEKLGAEGVLVSPVNVAFARRALTGTKTKVVCLAGGTGESLPVVKRNEAKRAAKQGAREIRLVCCYAALVSGNLAYLKREVKRVRRSVKKCLFTLSLEDHSLGEEQIAVAVRAAVEGGADCVTVRGELSLALRALEAGGGKIKVDCSGVENSERLRLLVKAGVSRLTTGNGEQIARELYAAVEEELLPRSKGEEEGVS